MSKFTMTTQKEVREAFWEQHPNLSRKRIRDDEGSGTIYTADTRVAFVDFVDYLQKDGQISEELADRVTLN